MILKKGLLYICVLVGSIIHGQSAHTIKGNFPEAKNLKIELSGFKVFKDTLLVQGTCDSDGNVSLSYPASYRGMAVLRIMDDKNLMLVLNGEDFSVSCSNLQDVTTVHFQGSSENNALAKGEMIVQESSAILAGLNYLKPLYAKSPNELRWIENEMAKKENSFSDFAKKIPDSYHAKYYLNMRKSILSFSLARDMKRLAEDEKEFMKIDFSDSRLVHSGLYKDLISSYYQHLENYGDRDIEEEHADAATVIILNSLKDSPVLKTTIATFLFFKLDELGLVKQAQYLALQMLNDGSCSLDLTNKSVYEQYLKVGVGKQAPVLSLSSNRGGIKNLSDVTAKYKLIVFGSSWCKKCQEELPRLNMRYQQWKDKYNLEIIFISLDTNAEEYSSFIKDFTWISSCDFKSWESQSVVDYCVFATPTMYLLNAENTILLKPFGAEQLDDWFVTVESFAKNAYK